MGRKINLLKRIEVKKDISNTEENVLAMAKNLVENEIREINNQVMTQKEHDSLVNPPESCGELSLYGVSDSRKLLIDPDGKGVENDPIQVSCYFHNIVTIICQLDELI